jgi:ADP-ribose pyrophosphatase YjhB (NUDIX family)
MMSTAPIQLLARGLLIDQGKILICQNKQHSYCYLPGGHIELGESAKQALVREIKEELNVSVTIGNFIGAVENKWVSNTHLTHEISFVFHVQDPALLSSYSPASAEPALTFRWVSLEELSHVSFLPLNMQPLIIAYAQDLLLTSCFIEMEKE